MPFAEQLRSAAGRVMTRAGTETVSALSLLRAGAFGLEPPQRLVRVLLAFRDRGPAGAVLAVACQRYPQHTAVIDELGELTFAELDDRSDRLADSIRRRGFADGDGIGILCRNHRGCLDALFAAAKLGARTVMLNTDFAGPQLADVCRREGVTLLIHDAEFSEVVGDYRPSLGVLLAWTDDEPADDEPADDEPADDEPADDELSGHTGDRQRLSELIAAGRPGRGPRPERAQQIVLLTSGTTGTPKGAPRDFGTSLAIPGGYLSRIPLRSQRTVHVGAPIFHAWGLLSSLIALALADTLVLSRRPDADRTAALLAEHRCDALITVPVLLSRLVDLGADSLGSRQLGALRIIAVSGSALPTELVERTRQLFGDVVYNLYGSTEVAYATIATPADLAAAPGTVGRAPYGTVIRLLDEDGDPAPPGSAGRIFVGNSFQFDGYTGGGGKEQIAGLMATGDIGHFDEAGRLFVDGRDDDMIVSGGENVFPAEVEELLTAHAGIGQAAVIGAPDPDYGQRLRAYVVRTGSEELDADQVRDYVRAHLARYKVPRDVVFVAELPRNPAGKVVKRELPDS